MREDGGDDPPPGGIAPIDAESSASGGLGAKAGRVMTGVEGLASKKN